MVTKGQNSCSEIKAYLHSFNLLYCLHLPSPFVSTPVNCCSISLVGTVLGHRPALQRRIFFSYPGNFRVNTCFSLLFPGYIAMVTYAAELACSEAGHVLEIGDQQV